MYLEVYFNHKFTEEYTIWASLAYYFIHTKLNKFDLRRSNPNLACYERQIRFLCCYSAAGLQTENPFDNTGRSSM